MNSRKVKSQSLGGVQHNRLCGKMKGQFASKDAMGRDLPGSCWREVVSSQLPALLADPVKVLKSDGTSKVIMGRLDFGGVEMAVVVKVYGAGKGIVGRLREVFRCKAMRNFKTSASLLELGIPVAFPLAAIKGRRELWTGQGVFVTEYVDGAVDLHDFLLENISLNVRAASGDLKIKKDLAEQIGRIFAALDNAGLWHRDSKAGNFLICPRKNAGFDVMLVDLDGIKRKLAKRRELGFRGLAKLASTLLWHGGISRSDYLRAFTIYSNLTALSKARRKQVFRRLAQRAVALRILTMAKAAINQKANS